MDDNFQKLLKNHAKCSELDVTHHFNQILNGEFNHIFINGILYDPNPFGDPYCDYCMASIGDETYKYCNNSCKNICKLCFAEKSEIIAVSNHSNDYATRKDELNECRLKHIITSQSIKYLSRCCNLCGEDIKNSYYNKNEYDLCLNCSVSEEGKAEICQNHLIFLNVTERFRVREFGSLLDWKPLIINEKQNKLLINSNPESKYYGKFCFWIMTNDLIKTCEFHTIWSNKTLDQLTINLS